MKELNDEDILVLLRNNRTLERGFRQLVYQNQERLYRHIRRFVDSHADADDVLQNTFLKAYRNIGTFKGMSTLYTWLYRIATNEALSLIRTKKKRVVHITATGDSPDVYAEPFFDSEEVQLRLREAIALLPDKQRTVFTLRYFEEMSYDEMSRQLDTSQGALKASYHHAAKKVESHLRSTSY